MTRAYGTALAILLTGLLATSQVQAEDLTGRFAASAGLLQSGGTSEPITGGLGFEVGAWFVLAESVDIGVRISSVSFDSDGLAFDEAPSLMSGSGSAAIADFAIRWYPLGSDRAFFPFVGLSAGFVFADSFTADTVEFPDLGIVLDTDWSIDSVGYGAEIGVRYDFADDLWFVEGGLRYVLLGAQSTGTFEVVPTITRSRLVDTPLDSYRLALHVGRYF